MEPIQTDIVVIGAGPEGYAADFEQTFPACGTGLCPDLVTSR